MNALKYRMFDEFLSWRQKSTNKSLFANFQDQQVRDLLAVLELFWTFMAIEPREISKYRNQQIQN